MGCDNRFTMKDLFMNPKLKKVFPQFENVKGPPVNSYAAVDKWVLKVLRTILNGRITGDNELTVNGKQKTVLRQVENAKTVVEDFFDNMSDIVKNLKQNTKLYTPFVSVIELENVNKPEAKAEILKTVLENIAYNPDIVGDGGSQTADFKNRQKAWMRTVGYKEIK